MSHALHYSMPRLVLNNLPLSNSGCPALNPIATDDLGLEAFSPELSGTQGLHESVQALSTCAYDTFGTSTVLSSVPGLLLDSTPEAKLVCILQDQDISQSIVLTGASVESSLFSHESRHT